LSENFKGWVVALGVRVGVVSASRALRTKSSASCWRRASAMASRRRAWSWLSRPMAWTVDAWARRSSSRASWSARHARHRLSTGEAVVEDQEADAGARPRPSRGQL